MRLIADAIDGVAGEYEGTMQDLKNLIDGLRMDVDQLLSRIQSLVYVPAGTTTTRRRSTRSTMPPTGEEPVPLAQRYGGDDLPRYARRGCRTARGRLM